MEIISTKDMNLVRNCALVQEFKLLNAPETSDSHLIAIQLNEYKKLVDSLNSGDSEKVNDALDNGVTEEFMAFCRSVRELTPQILAQKHVALTHDLIKMLYGNSPEFLIENKFQEFKKSFYKSNPELDDSDKTKNMADLEEEPEESPNIVLPKSLEDMKKLLQSVNPINITHDEFKEFCADYSNCTLEFAKEKFSKCFSENGYTLTGLSIGNNVDDDFNKVFETKFDLVDENHQTSTITHTESTSFIRSYYQNLCQAYLDAKSLSQKSDATLSTYTQEQLTEKISGFSTFFQIFTEMSQCNVAFKNDRFCYSITTAHTPNKILEEEGNEKPSQEAVIQNGVEPDER